MMEWLYPFLITFTLVFFSELGDKTQLLVLSFSTKNKTKHILLGVALGTFLSHGIAILFGSKVACFSSESFQFYLKLFTYTSFVLFGMIGFFPMFFKKTTSSDETNSHKFKLLEKFSHKKRNCILMVAFCILVGELGDKTFLASLSLGISYPNFRFSLLLGSICGMVTSNFIAIFCGKLIGSHLNQGLLEFLSNFLFLVFGILGFLHIIL